MQKDDLIGEFECSKKQKHLILRIDNKWKKFKYMYFSK